jgi:hypothetical protein
MTRMTTLEIGTILSHRTKQGMVELTLNGEKTQMDLDKARDAHASRPRSNPNVKPGRHLNIGPPKNWPT